MKKIPSIITFLMKFKFERIILKSLTSNYSNAYHRCSIMVKFKLLPCTIYESAAVIALMTIRIHTYYEFQASNALKFSSCGPIKFFQYSIVQQRPTGLYYLYEDGTCIQP